MTAPRVVGRGAGVAGWVFDILFGAFLGGLLAGPPLALVQLLVGDPGHVLDAGPFVAAVLGVRFLRRARRETGPAWWRR